MPLSSPDHVRFKEIAIAYEVLSDDRSKALYDTQRRYTGSAAARQGTPTPGPPREEEKMTPTRQKVRDAYVARLDHLH